MLWIVSYDIPNDKRRRKVAKVMEGFGRRAQYSVFECDLTLAKMAQLTKSLKRLINNEEDDVRFYPLNKADVQRVRLLGKAQLNRAKGWYMV
ncbi:CRISPR-associated endonuclease Cas2 [Phototrophicus methaneseepsis]|uniref:CRISPR-associated endoribonuclease Cas2 n=1 Tax=Phototrophicus methaneseepsis TaxID=2710758 RepID=A0A7S8E5W8_9CHLR|nr:CRISPR-associated endonuclease Cas2 [Phototrophicus methaneseepsis]QPC80920.1 CRISPR-associated endonuclease Cas2 [Phototrophicus methaneseepsis]